MMETQQQDTPLPPSHSATKHDLAKPPPLPKHNQLPPTTPVPGKPLPLISGKTPSTDTSTYTNNQPYSHSSYQTTNSNESNTSLSGTTNSNTIYSNGNNNNNNNSRPTLTNSNSPRSSSIPSQSPTDTRASSINLSLMGGDQLLDHSHLKPGNKASLLSYTQSINMYRENAKKTKSPDIQCDFAIFMVEAAKPVDDEVTRWEYLAEAEKLLKQLASRGHAESQYYLGNLYASGLLSKKNKNEFDKAFPFFVQASKHHHPDAAYRTAKCYEDGLGTRKDSSKAVQFYRKAATLNHPGSMYRMGVAEVNGELGISKNARDGVKWLKRAAEAATMEYPQAIHELALLHERGIDNVVFVDLQYAVTLYAQAADLGYAPSAFKLGECYEYGKLECHQDPALSIHYYTIAAQQGHREACFALTAWYLVGSPNVLPQSDADAYIWAKRAAEKELPKAEYAVGYFTEVGIGISKNLDNAMVWYKKAAEHGDKRAIQRLQGKPSEKPGKKKGSQDDCAIM
ncbi:unnamed protein product [Absidia cylindrospora]